MAAILPHSLYRLDKFSIAERSEDIAISDKEYYGAEVAFNNVI